MSAQSIIGGKEMFDPKFVGRQYGPMTYEVGREKAMEYARAIKSNDPHYLDEAFAKTTKYGGLIVPPTFAVVYSGLLCGPFFLDPELKIDFAMLVHGEQAFEFYEVVRPGDTITSSGVISKVDNKEKLDVVSFEILSKNQKGVEVCKATYSFAIRKRG